MSDEHDDPPPGSDGPASKAPTSKAPASQAKGTLIYGSPGDTDGDGPLAQLPSRARGADTDPPREPDARPSRRTTRKGTVMLDDEPGPGRPDAAPPVGDDAEGFSPPGSSRTTGKGTVMMDDPEVAPPDPPERGRGNYTLQGLIERSSQVGPPSVETVRESRERLSQVTISVRQSLAGKRKGTTLVELGTIAQDVAVVTQRGLPRTLGPSLLAASMFGVLLVSLALALLLPSARWIFTGLAFVAMLGLVAFAIVQGLPRLVRRLGDRTLPGGLHVWLGVLTLIVLGASASLTWGAQEATLKVAMITVPELVVEAQEEPDEAEEPTGPPADEALKKGGRPLRASPGTLYVPPHFSSPNGTFDMVMMFHGNPPLVQDSIDAAKLNAVVHITNLGLGGAPYKARLARPDAFDLIVGKARKALEDAGLKGAKVGRVAVVCWSAGYGALFQILKDEKRDQNIDAVLALDGLHGSFIGGGREVMPESVAPYVEYGRLAMGEERLFVITHSAITTSDYASSTESADAILAGLGLERSDPTTPAPAGVSFDSAVKAFPKAQPQWLKPTSEVHAGNFHLFAYEGRTKEDHIAHLAQMSESVLPMLKARWE